MKNLIFFVIVFFMLITDHFCFDIQLFKKFGDFFRSTFNREKRCDKYEPIWFQLWPDGPLSFRRCNVSLGGWQFWCEHLPGRFQAFGLLELLGAGFQLRGSPESFQKLTTVNPGASVKSINPYPWVPPPLEFFPPCYFPIWSPPQAKKFSGVFGPFFMQKSWIWPNVEFSPPPLVTSLFRTRGGENSRIWVDIFRFQTERFTKDTCSPAIINHVPRKLVSVWLQLWKTYVESTPIDLGTRSLALWAQKAISANGGWAKSGPGTQTLIRPP